jgi:deoxycytidine triphosphate deaminase
MTSTVHPWKYEDPQVHNAGRKGMLLSNEIRRFCDESVRLLIAENFGKTNLRPAAYTLRIGDKFVDSRGKPGVLDDKNSYFEMEPNSIVYVSTYEKLDLPFYIAARFNLRVKWVYRGILLGTGPQVEPGYKGYLSCPLYNLTDRPIRIAYREDFATIDFERTTDFCPGASAEVIQSSLQKGDQLDSVQFDGEEYLLFKQAEYAPLKHLPLYDVVSSLVQMSNEVRMWRHIGIGVIISFFALALTLLSFGNNLYTHFSNLLRDSKQIEIRLMNAEIQTKQVQSQLDALRADFAKQASAPSAVVPSTPKRSQAGQTKGEANP